MKDKNNVQGRRCVDCVCTKCGHHNEVKDSPSNVGNALCDGAKPMAGETCDSSCASGLTCGAGKKCVAGEENAPAPGTRTGKHGSGMPEGNSQQRALLGRHDMF